MLLWTMWCPHIHIVSCDALKRQICKGYDTYKVIFFTSQCIKIKYSEMAIKAKFYDR